MKTKLHKRILSAFLALAMLVGYIPMRSSAETTQEAFIVTRDGAQVTDVTFAKNKKPVITVEGLPDGAQPQWQIKLPGVDSWVDIYGQIQPALTLSYALICSIMEDDWSTAVRCVGVVGNVDTYYTDPVRVQAMEVATYSQETVPATVETTPVEAAVESTETVTEPAAAATEPVTEPSEATTEPSETTPASAEGETAPAEETAEPTEAVTESTEETSQPAEAVTEPTEGTVQPVQTEPDETVSQYAETVVEPMQSEVFFEEIVTESASMAAETLENASEWEIQTVSDSAQPMLASDTDAPEFVTVRIEYIRYDFKRDAAGKLVLDTNNELVLEENGQAFTPYIATLRYGSDLQTTVPNPTMMGYDAFLEDGAEAITSVAIDLKDIQEDKVYTVKYRPAEVDYTVRYYFQNVYDDLYVEDTDKKYEGKGYTGAVPSEDVLKKAEDGYTALYYQPDMIAADGSTIFEVYYERNYYLMEFDCNGGYGAETLYVRYGTYITVPNPVKSGYNFAGWDLVKTEDSDNQTPLEDESRNDLPETMPAYNSGYKAIWATTSTKYTIVYWSENADDGHYSYWGTASANATSAVELVPVEVAKITSNSAQAMGLVDAQHFTLNEARTAAENPETVLVEGDGSTIINVYYARNLYTINFVKQGTCLLEEHQHTVDCYEYYCDAHVHSASCYVCDMEEHTHTDKCCGLAEHPSHTIACYTSETGYDEVTSGTHSNRVGNIDDPQAGTVYKYRYTSWGSTYYANYFYDGTSWYYLGNGTEYSGVEISTIDTPTSANSYTSAAAKLICGQVLHTHGVECSYICNKTPHTHSAGCYICNQENHIHSSACCATVVHTHSITCYNPDSGYVAATNQHTGYSTISDITDPLTGYVYRVRSGYNNATYHNYFYDGTTWYYLGSGNQYRGLVESVSNPDFTSRYSYARATREISCGIAEHDHTSGCDYSNCTAHVHDSTCFRCGNHHEHSATCDRHLKCILTEHTHTTSCNSSNATNSVYSVTAKYDADIQKIWEEDPIKSYLDGGAVWQSNLTQKYYSFLEKMPSSDVTMTYTEWSGNTYTWYYYLEVRSPYEDTTGLTLRTDGGKTYKLYHTTSVNGSNISLTYEEDYFPITGYTQRDDSVPEFSDRIAYFYYTINSHELRFYNRSDESPTPDSQTLVYGQPIESFEPSAEEMNENYYPSGVEPGVYKFEGWYTSPACFDGTEVDWDSLTMPDNDLELYAKWTPIKRNVYFYQRYDYIGTENYWQPVDENGEVIKPEIQYPIVVDHGSLLGTTYNYTPAWEGYDFVGWFYMDEDNKKRFAPDSMEIIRDLHLFAEWQSAQDAEYMVTYVLENDVTLDDGRSYSAGTEIAEATAGHASAGMTKTFSAKGGTDLGAAFRTKFFPTTNSHSVLMQAEQLNSYSFTYVYDANVTYKIRYVDVATGAEIATSVTKTTDEAYVTEKFLPVNGYIPQKYYISKALVSDGDDPTAFNEANTITFYYVQDIAHGLYSIEYYLETMDSTTEKRDYAKSYSIVGSADIGETISGQIRPYEGYEHVPSLDTVITYNEDGTIKEEIKNVHNEDGEPNGTVEYTGLTIQLYYNRIEYPYIIEYREYGAADNADPLRVIADGSMAKFDSVVTYSLVDTEANRDDTTIEVNGKIYEYYITDPKPEDLTKSMTIRAYEDDPDTQEVEENPNILIFYFTLKKIPVEYHVICTVPNATNFGAVSRNAESVERVEQIQGSIATPAAGFEFLGWFHDEAHTQPVDGGWVTEGTDGYELKPKELTPASTDETDHYYALFAPITSSLTITKTVSTSSGEKYDTTDSFLFRVQGKPDTVTAGVDVTVAIQGNDMATVTGLYCGDYTIEELTGWSWAYTLEDDSSRSITVVEDAGENVVTFSNIYNAPNWLNGESSNENRFGGVSESQ